MYQDFLGARLDRGGSAPVTVLTQDGYDLGYSQLNLHLVRFILERIASIRLLSRSEAVGGLVARAEGGSIELSPLFQEENGAINLASLIVHEARHISGGFPDGSGHVSCDSKEESGLEVCDDFMFGAYGAQLSYIDSVLRGSLQAVLEDGTPVLSALEVRSLVKSACSRYRARLSVQDGEEFGELNLH